MDHGNRDGFVTLSGDLNYPDETHLLLTIFKFFVVAYIFLAE